MKKFMFVLLLLVLPLVSAQFVGFKEPSDLLKNPYVTFVIFFILFFAVIYFALGKSLKGNVAIPGIISAALAFLIAAGIQQEWQILQKPLIFWAIVFGIVLVFVLFFIAIATHTGIAGGIMILAGLWGFLPFIIKSLPYKMQVAVPRDVLYFLEKTYGWGLIIFFVALVYVAWRLHYVWKWRWRTGI